MLLLGRHILPGKKNYPFLQTAPCQGAQFGSSPTQCLRWEPLHSSQPAQPCTGALGSANTASSLPACHSSQLKGKLPLQTVRATLCLFPKSPSLFNWFNLMKKIFLSRGLCWFWAFSGWSFSRRLCITCHCRFSCFLLKFPISSWNILETIPIIGIVFVFFFKTQV